MTLFSGGIVSLLTRELREEEMIPPQALAKILCSSEILIFVNKIQLAKISLTEPHKFYI